MLDVTALPHFLPISDSMPRSTNSPEGYEDPSSVEAALVNCAIPSLLSVLSIKSPARVVKEVRTGRVIADIVIARASASRQVPPRDLTAHESAILSGLRRSGSTRIDLLERRAGLPHKSLRETADRFSDWKLVRRERGGLIVPNTSWVTRPRLIAIEAKLRRWRDALSQAIEYTRFANKAYVLLPEASAEPAIRKRAQFEKPGIGLLVYGESGLRVIFPAVALLDHDWRREYLLSRVFR